MELKIEEGAQLVKEERICLIPNNDFYSLKCENVVGNKLVVIAGSFKEAVIKMRELVNFYIPLESELRDKEGTDERECRETCIYNVNDKCVPIDNYKCPLDEKPPSKEGE